MSSKREKSFSQNQSPAQDTDEDEPVYIQMVGNILRDLKSEEDDDQGESVYEEMKYPMFDDLVQDSRWEQGGSVTPSILDMEPGHSYTPRGSFCDIPAPFPNLLTHRPPLLVFPPAPVKCSPNSDESPLTPLDVGKLLMQDNIVLKPGASPPTTEAPPSSSHHRKAERERETHTITTSGRSSAPPLPSNLYKSSALVHGYPRSHSACPSPVSMGRSLTPLSLKHPPPYEAVMTGSMPRSASSVAHAAKASSGQEGGGKLSGSMQNVSRTRTPTSPLDELTNLLSSGRSMMKKPPAGRKAKDSADCEY